MSDGSGAGSSSSSSSASGHGGGGVEEALRRALRSPAQHHKKATTAAMALLQNTPQKPTAASKTEGGGMGARSREDDGAARARKRHLASRTPSPNHEHLAKAAFRPVIESPAVTRSRTTKDSPARRSTGVEYVEELDMQPRKLELPAHDEVDEEEEAEHVELGGPGLHTLAARTEKEVPDTANAEEEQQAETQQQRRSGRRRQGVQARTAAAHASVVPGDIQASVVSALKTAQQRSQATTSSPSALASPPPPSPSSSSSSSSVLAGAQPRIDLSQPGGIALALADPLQSSRPPLMPLGRHGERTPVRPPPSSIESMLRRGMARGTQRLTRHEQLLQRASQLSSSASAFAARFRRPRPQIGKPLSPNPALERLPSTVTGLEDSSKDSAASPGSPSTAMPPSPRRSPRKSPLDSPIRPQDLRTSQAIDKSHASRPSELRLPAHCMKILRQFEQLDIIGSHVAKKYMRTFDRVQPGVEKMTKRSFALADLGRIMHIWPTCYKLEQVLIKDAQRGTGEYKLKMTPLMPSADGDTEHRRYLSVAEIHDRVSTFHMRLLNYVHTHHEKHLATLPGKPSVPLAKLQRWHSGFQVEQVPAIPVGEVPRPPERRVMTAMEALSQSLGLTSGAQKALEKTVALSAKHTSPLSSPKKRGLKEDVSASSEEEKVASPLKGLVSDAMMARIRAKQKKRTEASLQLDSAATQRRSLLTRLPTVATTIWTEGKRRAAGPMDRWLPAITKSCGLSNAAAEQHIDLLMELVPTFIKRFLRDNRTPYMKVNTSIPLSKIKQAIKDEEARLNA
ncbi:hypothetical protein PTSG_06320 [Salpingoeca rosetta]|uniref:CDT1 Geminin-binding domain-containing protein n=1 Tax=Salpingoeca rosetta (strain ATCC 50818 / BSB-021) TaxID=946362 RepID=F2UCK4_SALR5|nr:uncharacterized protein PTSG_06320 [Salpingoeca rosetta]EGD74311.1 hypothetical protein PTSG_06320 [Salpingoeca rosetta]|eukprot:XP_004993211.1 hypothetical protein PTSG_06320 [Salpingoeca rosetta]